MEHDNLINSKILLDTKEAAIFLNVSVRQIREFKKKGFIPYLQVGGRYGHIKFKIEWLENFINENKR